MVVFLKIQSVVGVIFKGRCGVFFSGGDGAMGRRLARLFTISPTLHRTVGASLHLFNFLLSNQSLRFAVVAIFKNVGGFCGGPGRRAGSGASNCQYSGGANQQ